MIENILLILTTNSSILLVPRVHFYLISNISMGKGLRFGLLVTCGTTISIMMHVIFSIMISYTIFLEYQNIFILIKIIGMAYITWLAYKLLKPIVNSHIIIKRADQASNIKFNSNFFLRASPLSTFCYGVYADLFYPYITIFLYFLILQIISDKITNISMLIYIGTVFLLIITWFTLIAILFAQNIIRRYYYRYKILVDGASAIFLMYFAIRLYSC